MNRFSPPFWIKPRWLLFLLLPLCGGCLKGDVFEFISYDAATDTFRYMQLDLNVAGEASGDRDYLVGLWNKREQIIMHPDFIRLWNLPAVLRIDSGHFQMINLGSASADNNPTLASMIPLATIKVQPGKFFLTNDGTLGYSHQVVVGGSVVDTLLVEMSKQFFGPEFVAAIDREIQRRVPGGPTESWDEFRRQLSEGFQGNKPTIAAAAVKSVPLSKTTESGQKQQGAPGNPLDAASLAMLRKAAAAGEIAIHRHGAELELAFPLSSDDCREAKTTVDLLTKYVVDQLKAKPGDAAASLWAMLHAENDGGRRLVLTVDVRLLTKLQQSTYPTAAPVPKLAAVYQATVSKLRERGIPIDEKLTAKQVVENFIAEGLTAK
jgi:hypothetical protein